MKLQIVPPQELSEIEQDYYEKIQANSSFNPRSAIEAVIVLDMAQESPNFEHGSKHYSLDWKNY